MATGFQPASSLIEEREGILLSPGFRSAAAIAGWDEEALLVASLVVEDTPIRQSKILKTPPDPSLSSSRRKRKSRRQSPRIPPVTLILDEDDASTKAAEEQQTENKVVPIPCLDKLREELSCAICLEICFEPSTTPCGHSFCKKCLKRSTTTCGRRCPKCRDLIGNARSCTINSVLWNTIQLLFPAEIAARRSLSSPTPSSSGKRSRPSISAPDQESEDRSRSAGRRTWRPPPRERRSGIVEIGGDGRTTRTTAGQSEDAALALRLQREETMAAYRERSTVYVARANLRAIASRAMHVRTRRRQS